MKHINQNTEDTIYFKEPLEKLQVITIFIKSGLEKETVRIHDASMKIEQCKS